MSSSTLRLLRLTRKKVGAFALEERRAPTARLIARFRSLDLDHVGPEIAEHHRAVRSRERLRHVDDFDSGQRCNVSHERSELCSIIAR